MKIHSLFFLIPCLLFSFGCAAPSMRTIQLVDYFRAATDSYATCLPMHVIDTGQERLFFRYQLDGNFYPILESMKCVGLVLPESGSLEVMIKPLPQPMMEDMQERVRVAGEKLRATIIEQRHPDPLDAVLIPDEKGILPSPCVFMN